MRPLQLPSSIQGALDQFRSSPQNALAIGTALVTLILLIASPFIANTLSEAPPVEPQNGESVIQVVTTDGKSAGVCALGGLVQEKVHYTDKDSIYRTQLLPGAHTISASCPSVAALSSGSRTLEGKTTVTVAEKPQVVRIVVR
ncbi:hypothetical protein [Corynebacterium sp. Marseille-P4321]|uniref:hypothetical protein n=1 Tax=Corynebacterium sp. Marseille-P4321 TaxID=2736603 RepID=UPI00158F48E7|nr:hypothetical protein [Corynebacterium sp. Marseille-P4321]